MGGFLAKLSVSALIFDYVLTGPISGVSAGQYIMGILLGGLRLVNPHLQLSPDLADPVRRWGAVAIACAITLYFFRQNILGIHESSGKALKIVLVTSMMAVIMLAWCTATLLVKGPANPVLAAPDLSLKVEYEEFQGVHPVTGVEHPVWKRDPATGRLIPKMEADAQGVMRPVPKHNEVTGRQEDPLGWIDTFFPNFADEVRRPGSWLSIVGLIGLLLAFGHSILAMSGEETLAQVYREVESPKLPNFKKAAWVVFLYSLVLTTSISFLAVALIPDEIRMKDYADNLIGGLAMQVNGPWNVATIQNLAPDKNWGVALVPKADDGVYASVLGGENFGPTTACKDLDAAVEFLTWLMSKDVSANFCEAGGKFSPRADSSASKEIWTTDPIFSVFAAEMQYAMPRGPHPRWPEISTAISVAEHEAFTGVKTPQEALDGAAATVSAILAQ